MAKVGVSGNRSFITNHNSFSSLMEQISPYIKLISKNEKFQLSNLFGKIIHTVHINFHFAIFRLFTSPGIIERPKKMILRNTDIFGYAKGIT